MKKEYTPQELQSIVESLLFVSALPLPVMKIKDVVGEEVEAAAIKDAAIALQERYSNDEGCGLQVVEVAGGYQMCTKPEVTEYLEKFREKKKKTTLSGPALETLAIIAYKQPLTRLEMEAIRGVSVDGVVHTLLERRLIKISGRKDIPGKPFLYRTTKEFLEHFGLNSLKDLPPIEDLGTLLKHYSNQNSVEPAGPPPDESPSLFEEVIEALVEEENAHLEEMGIEGFSEEEENETEEVTLVEETTEPLASEAEPMEEELPEPEEEKE